MTQPYDGMSISDCLAAIEAYRNLKPPAQVCGVPLTPEAITTRTEALKHRIKIIQYFQRTGNHATAETDL